MVASSTDQTESILELVILNYLCFALDKTSLRSEDYLNPPMCWGNQMLRPLSI